jgi:hypothetical protein
LLLDALALLLGFFEKLVQPPLSLHPFALLLLKLLLDDQKLLVRGLSCISLGRRVPSGLRAGVPVVEVPDLSEGLGGSGVLDHVGDDLGKDLGHHLLLSFGGHLLVLLHDQDLLQRTDLCGPILLGLAEVVVGVDGGLDLLVEVLQNFIELLFLLVLASLAVCRAVAAVSTQVLLGLDRF